MAGTSYTRQSTIADGNLITAALFNNEFNQIVNAFAYSASGTTGHTHDGSAAQGGAISKIGDQDFKNKIVVSATDNRIEFYAEVGGAPVEQVRIQDGAIVPVTDSDVDLGTTSVRFKDAYVDSVTVTNNIVVAGTVDGRDVAADGTKLDGVEASATADQTDAEIRAAVEAATDSNVFTDADHTKLNAIEASADVTDTTNVTAAGALMDSEVTNLAQVKAFDSSDYATAAQGTTADAALPKAGGAMTGAITTNSTFDGRDVATDGTKLDGIEASADVTDTTNVTAAGALMDSEVTNLAQVKAFDSSDYATAAQGTTADAALPKAGGALTGAVTTNSTFDGRDVAADGTKLDGIEASADVTDTTNVVASLTAGSNITIAADGTIASTASGGGGETLQQTLAIGNTTTTDTKIQFRDTGLYINSSADGQLDIVADTEVQIAATTVDVNGILDVSGNIVAGGTVDGRDVATDGTKLDGIEASADVTDTANVTAAGALMDSELTSEASVKALNQGVATTDSPTFTAINVNGLVTSDDLQIDLGTATATAQITTPSNLSGFQSFQIKNTHTEGYLSFGTALGESRIQSSGTFGAADPLKIDVGNTTAIKIDDTGVVRLRQGITENKIALAGTTTTINLNLATNFVHDLVGNTTYTFSNPAVAGEASAFTLKIIQGSTARTITWPSSVDWAGGTAPTLSTANNAVDIFTFFTLDAGTTYYGFAAGQAMA